MNAVKMQIRSLCLSKLPKDIFAILISFLNPFPLRPFVIATLEYNEFHCRFNDAKTGFNIYCIINNTEQERQIIPFLSNLNIEEVKHIFENRVLGIYWFPEDAYEDDITLNHALSQVGIKRCTAHQINALNNRMIRKRRIILKKQNEKDRILDILQKKRILQEQNEKNEMMEYLQKKRQKLN
jgi:hypothetical protein